MTMGSSIYAMLLPFISAGHEDLITSKSNSKNQADSSLRTSYSLVFYFIFGELRAGELGVMRDSKELHENQRETKQKH